MTTTRRTVLVGAAAMPLLPAAALAAPVTQPLLPASAFAQPADPAVEAFRRWHPAFMAYITAANRPDCPDHYPIVDAAEEAHDAAMLPFFDVIATTPAGLAGQLRLAFYTFGEVPLGGDWDNPKDYQFGADGWGQAERLMCSMLAGAERMAGVAS